jgi:4-hydroxybenzoate polyprenyltransferase
MTIPTPPHIPPPFIRRFAPLVLNHIDAWATTAVIVSLVLWQHTTPTTPLVHAVLLLAITATYWYGFALNDYYDAEHDSRAPHKAARNFFWPRARWKTHADCVRRSRRRAVVRGVGVARAARVVRCACAAGGDVVVFRAACALEAPPAG